eukprot:957253-Rhodomonas_salina.1
MGVVGSRAGGRGRRGGRRRGGRVAALGVVLAHREHARALILLASSLPHQPRADYRERKLNESQG